MVSRRLAGRRYQRYILSRFIYLVGVRDREEGRNMKHEAISYSIFLNKIHKAISLLLSIDRIEDMDSSEYRAVLGEVFCQFLQMYLYLYLY